MMSPRRKLSCEESCAEKSNCAWAKQAWADCGGREWSVGPPRRPRQRFASSCKGRGVRGKTEVERACAYKAR